jgi:anti-sigma factor RsiW
MAEKDLEQVEIEELTAWMDGELPPDRQQRAAAMVRERPDWRAAHRDFLAVDAALELLPAPAPSGDLTDRIVRAAHRRRLAARVFRALAPLAAAAAIVVAVYLGSRPGPVGAGAVERIVNEALVDVPEQDRLMVWKLPVFQNYSDIVSYQQVRSVIDGETLSALGRLEADGRM